MSEDRDYVYCESHSCQKTAKVKVDFTIGELRLHHDLCEECFIEFMRKCQSPELKVTNIISLDSICLSRMLHNVVTNTIYEKVLKNRKDEK